HHLTDLAALRADRATRRGRAATRSARRRLCRETPHPTRALHLSPARCARSDRSPPLLRHGPPPSLQLWAGIWCPGQRSIMYGRSPPRLPVYRDIADISVSWSTTAGAGLFAGGATCRHMDGGPRPAQDRSVLVQRPETYAADARAKPVAMS